MVRDTTHDRSTTAADGPLAGTLVVDLSRALAGPHATMMLGDLGARVIKVEAPGSGDDTRGWGPPFVGPEPRRTGSRRTSCRANRNKESIALDLKDDADRRGAARAGRPRRRAGRELPHRRPRAARPRHRGAACELNPRLVVLSITGFGHDGPEGGRAGYDQIAQGEAGLMSLTGSGPGRPAEGRRTRSPTCWPACTAPTACSPRSTSANAPGAARSCARRCWPRSSACTPSRAPGGRSPARSAAAQGNHHPSIAPYGLFHCRDGAVQIAVGSEGLWRRFCAGFGLDPDAEGWRPTASGSADRERVIEVVEAGVRRLGRRAAARPARRGRRPGRQGAHPRRGLRVGPDRQPGTADRRRAPHARRASPSPARRCGSSTPTGAEVTRRDHAAPPLLDQHADEIRAWLGGGRVVTRRWTAHELLDLVLDAGTFASWDEPDRPVRRRRRATAPRSRPRQRRPAPTSRC